MPPGAASGSSRAATFAVAIEITVGADDDVAKLMPVRRRSRRSSDSAVSVRKRLPHLERAPHRGDRTRKVEKGAVAHRLEDAAAVERRRRDQPVMQPREWQ